MFLQLRFWRYMLYNKYSCILFQYILFSLTVLVQLLLQGQECKISPCEVRAPTRCQIVCMNATNIELRIFNPRLPASIIYFLFCRVFYFLVFVASVSTLWPFRSVSCIRNTFLCLPRRKNATILGREIKYSLNLKE